MTTDKAASPVPRGTEFVVVECRFVGNPEQGYDEARWALHRSPSLYEAKRWGLRHFGHDDFNIAVVEHRDQLVRWTWMGEDIEHDPYVLDVIARDLGWRLSSHPVLASRRDNTDSPACPTCRDIPGWRPHPHPTLGDIADHCLDCGGKRSTRDNTDSPSSG